MSCHLMYIIYCIYAYKFVIYYVYVRIIIQLLIKYHYNLNKIILNSIIYFLISIFKYINMLHPCIFSIIKLFKNQ